MIAGILLAAGESSRMGRLKALLQWRGKTLLECQLEAMCAAQLRPTIVVLGHEAELLRTVMAAALTDLARFNPQVDTVLNARYREGKSTSIVAGVSALPQEAAGVIIVAVDQPCEVEVLQALFEAHTSTRAGIVLPSYQGRRGHPTLFDRSLFPELAAVSEERQGLREVMSRHEGDIRYVNVSMPLVRVNLNSPQEYEAAVRQYGQASIPP